jgi:hypothetical protein
MWKNNLLRKSVFVMLPSSNTSADFAKGKIPVWLTPQKSCSVGGYHSFGSRILLYFCRSLLLGLGIASSAYALEIQNPIAPTSSFLQLIINISKAVTMIATPLAIAAIVFVGFKLVVAAAQGNDKGLQDGKKMLWWVLIGTAIIIGASVLAQVVVNFAKTLNN